MALFYPSSRDFIGPLLLDLSKSVKFCQIRCGKGEKALLLHLRCTSEFKNLTVGEKDIVITAMLHRQHCIKTWPNSCRSSAPQVHSAVPLPDHYF